MADRVFVLVSIFCLLLFTNAQTVSQSDIQQRLEALETKLLKKESELATLIHTLQSEHAGFNDQIDKITDLTEVLVNGTGVSGESRDNLLACLSAIGDEGEPLKDCLAAESLARGTNDEPVAFTAVYDKWVEPFHIFLKVIPLGFNKVLSNEGNGYNNDTGIFTSPKAGVYMFYFSVKHHGYFSMNSPVVAQLMINDDSIGPSVYIVTYDPEEGYSISSMVILRLEHADEVWVQPDGDVDIDSAAVTFSGVRIAP